MVQPNSTCIQGTVSPAQQHAQDLTAELLCRDADDIIPADYQKYVLAIVDCGEVPYKMLASSPQHVYWMRICTSSPEFQQLYWTRIGSHARDMAADIVSGRIYEDCYDITGMPINAKIAVKDSIIKHSMWIYAKVVKHLSPTMVIESEPRRLIAHIPKKGTKIDADKPKL